MTYVLGFGQPGLNAIIVDARVSWKGESGEWIGSNTSMKSGLLFPGCMYARLGNVFAAQSFVKDYKERILGTYNTIIGVWNGFVNFADSYPYDPDIPFKLLISSRHSGTPKFYILDSSIGLREFLPEKDDFIITYGSGKPLLDPIVYSEFLKRIEKYNEFVRENDDMPDGSSPSLLLPYLICLWLSEMSLTFESSEMERHKVGGVFHFIIQSSESESGQRPALYIFNSAHRKKPNKYSIYSWSYRVVYVAGSLYIEKRTPEGQTEVGAEATVERHLFSDSAARLDLTTTDSEDFLKEFREKLNKLSFYEFAGFGFTDPSLRGNFSSFISPSGTYEDVFDSEGFFQPKFHQMIVSTFRGSGYFDS